MGDIMGNATTQTLADLGASFYGAAKASEGRREREAASENGRNPTDNGAGPFAPVVLCGDDARQGVTGHNVRYVLGFGLLGAVAGLAIAAFVAGHGFATMLPGITSIAESPGPPHGNDRLAR
jgi:hypothetical protein